MTVDSANPVRVVLRPTSNPLPLGFLGLALATTMFAGLQLGWFGPAYGSAVAITALCFTVPAQFMASIFGFLARDAVAATGMAVLAATWTGLSVLTLTSPPGTTSASTGLFLVMAGVTLAVPAGPAWRLKLAPAAVLTTAALRFVVTGIHQLTGHTAWETAAGVVGLVLAAFALYTAAALELEDSGVPLLPVGRLHAGRSAMTMPLANQVDDVQHEAGVRQQL